MFDFLKNIFIFVTGAISIVASPFMPADKIDSLVSPMSVIREVRQEPTSTPTPSPSVTPAVYKEVKGIQVQVQAPIPTLTSTPAPIQKVNTYTQVFTLPTISQQNTHSDAYWEFQIKQAEKEAKEAEEARKAREAYDQQCKESRVQRSAALAPIEIQIAETQNKLWTVEERVNERIKGTFTNEAQRLRMIEAETHDLQNQLNKLQNEYNAIYSQYGSC